MSERTISSNSYRYGINGKEKDEDGEWGNLTNYDYGFRIYNPGIGKFLSVDPLTQSYPWNSPYSFAENDVIRSIDLDGLEKAIVITIGYDVEYRGPILDQLNDEDVIQYHLKADSPTLPQDLVQALKNASGLDAEGIGFLAIYSHGSPKSGIWGKEKFGGAVESYWNSKIAFGDDVDFKLLSEAVKDGEVKFASKSTIYLGGCNQCLGVLNSNYSPSQAEKWSKAVNGKENSVLIIGANESISPKNDKASLFQVSYYDQGVFLKLSPNGESDNLGNTFNVNESLIETMSIVRDDINNRNKQKTIQERKKSSRVIKPVPTLKLDEIDY